jgi:hypothetical protein
LEGNIKIRLIKLKEVSFFIHLNDVKSIENWCRVNGLDIHIQRKRKYVYEHELLKTLEYNYVNDTMKIHPNDFMERCSEHVSNSTLIKFSGCTAGNSNITTNQYSFLPTEVQDILKTI